MSEGVIADFVARFVPVLDGQAEPVRGRVVLSQRRLVLAESGGRTTIALSGIFDVTLGRAPRELARFFDDVMTVAYERGGTRRVAVIEGDSGTIERFANVLFKVLLSGTSALVVHPARVGGRVTNAPVRETALRLRSGTVSFRGSENPVTIALSAVTHFEKHSREVRGRSRPVLSVRHTHEGTAMTTEAILASGRKMNLLGRYLQREYAEVMADLGGMELSDEETEALVALYSAPEGASLARLLGADSGTVNLVLERLRKSGLIANGENTTELTPKGQTVVSTRIEDVNA